MLVLSRKKDERILINNEIEITVLRVKGNRVSLGIKAPRNVTILRGEFKRSDDSEMTPSLAGNDA